MKKIDLADKIFLRAKQAVFNLSGQVVNFFKQHELELVKIARVFLILFSVGITLFFFETKLNRFLLKYVIPPPGWSNHFIDGLFLLACVILYICGIRLLIRRYIFSTFQILILLSGILVLVILHTSEKDWKFSPVLESNSGITYFHFIFGVGVHFLGVIIYNFLRPKVQKTNLRSFCEDNSINGKFDQPDLLDYTKLTIDLKEKISKQSFENSFTVGIVGPWGNGKSSFINLFENEIRKTDSIAFHFKPYLNHTEEEISMEFFHAFQEALRPHSAKVSDLILEYADKLLNLYHTKNIKNFFKRETANIDSSANSTFSKINSSLEEINKKIIVYVDDLDRLNDKEILQVLKLIRNTANFSNTTFIVGMDKGYVLNRLVKYPHLLGQLSC